MTSFVTTPIALRTNRSSVNFRSTPAARGANHLPGLRTPAGTASIRRISSCAVRAISGFTPCRPIASVIFGAAVEQSVTGARPGRHARHGQHGAPWTAASAPVASAEAIRRPARSAGSSGRRVTAVTSCPAVGARVTNGVLRSPAR
ncbi:hypothetical protein [Streptomyces hygroscopicus]|uniref:hypothetical protein n=1 Tax=Streptomyces hygroscopicus TaxID=1912 RepID=UPI00223F3886|nr:hypothetical protein [Streptomyces hygroscopicus]